MTDVLFALLRLAAFVLMTWAMGTLLASGWERIERRLCARTQRCAKLPVPGAPTD